MAYIVSTTQTATAAAASYTVTLGAHQSGDLLLVKLSQDGGGTAIAPDATATTAGWAMIGTQAASGVCRSAWAFLIADSSSEVNPTFTGANDDWIGTCVVIRDAHATAPFGSLVSGTDFVRTDWNNVSSSASGSVTTAVDGCLILYSWNADGNTQYPRCKLQDAAAVDKYSTANITHIIACKQQQTAGAAPTVTMYNINATEGGNGWVLAVRNKSGGVLQPDIRPTITELQWHGSYETTHDSITWQAMSNFAATINGINTSAVAPTVANNTSIPDSGWGLNTQLSCSDNTAGLWVGGTFSHASIDMSGKVFGVQWSRSSAASSGLQGADGVLIGFSDGTNWVVYQIGKPDNGWATAGPEPAFIALGNAAAYASSGSINWAAVTRRAYAWHRTGSVATTQGLLVKNSALFGTTALTGGGSSRPAKYQDYVAAMNSWGVWEWAKLNASSQVIAKSSLQIGDGTNVTYFDGAAASLEFPQAWSATSNSNWQMRWNALAGSVGLAVKAHASDTILMASGVAVTNTQQALTIDASSSASASYDFAQSYVGWAPTLKTGINEVGSTFKSCGKIAAKGSNLTDCTIGRTTATDAAINWDTTGAVVTRTTIDLTGSTTSYHIELGTAVTAITLADVTFTGTPGTNKIHVLKTSGTVDITISGSTSLSSGEVTSAGATVNIVAPSYYRGIIFTGLIAGSKVKVFATGTDTELFSTASSGTSETFDDATNGSITVDYTIQQAGYLPRRVTGVVLTGQTTTAGLSPVQGLQTAARWYQASSGLTINTNAFANATTKKWGLTTASTLQNCASYLLEQWIALGDTGEAFANKPFPLEANGPNSFSWLDGWEADLTTYPNSISLLSRDGMRYLSSGGAVTAIWAALLSNGVPAGKQVRYQQQDGVGTTNALTTGNIDQLIQIYGDATHGNYDKRGWLVLKVQTLGDYDQAEADAVVTYGTLEDQLYVVGLAPTPNGVPAQAGITGITITSEPTPVLWNGQLFSVTITDTTDAHSGLQIMQYVRGLNEFNWHDMIRPSGSKFVTVNGAVYGDTLPTPAGVRVVKADGTTPHPDFSAFAADNGAVYTPPVSAPISWAGALDGTTVLLYNDSVAGSPIIDTQTISGAGGYSLAVSLPSGIVAAGDSLRLRYGNKAHYAGELQGTMTTSGLAFLGTMVLHPIYAAWALNGSTYDQASGGPYTMDGTHLQVDIAAGATTGLKTQLAAWTQHLMTLPAGLDAFYGAWDLLDLNQIRQNVGVVDVLIDVPTAGALFTFTDNNVNYYRSDFTFPGNVEAGHGLIAMTYNASPFVATVSGENVVTGTAAEIIAAIPTAVAGKVLGARTLGQHIQAQSAALLGETTGAGTSHLTFTDGAATVEADVPLPGVAGDRSNVVISGV